MVTRVLEQIKSSSRGFKLMQRKNTKLKHLKFELSHDEYFQRHIDNGKLYQIRLGLST